MTKAQVKKCEAYCPEAIIIESEANALHYVYGEDRNTMYVSGNGETYTDNICKITMQRAKEIIRYIKDHGTLPNFDGRYFVFGGFRNRAILTEKQNEVFCREFEDMVDMRKSITARAT